MIKLENVPLSNFSLAGIIRLWSKYDACVYELTDLSTREQVERFLDRTEGQSTISSIPAQIAQGTTRLVGGTMYVDMQEAIQLMELADASTPSSSPTTYSEKTYKYGPNDSYSAIRICSYVRHSNTDNSSVDIEYRDYKTSGLSYNAIRHVTWRDTTPPGKQLYFQSFNGGCGGFIRFKDGNEYKYVRVYVFVMPVDSANPDNSAISVSTWANSIENRGKNFYGCVANKILSLSEICNGTAEYTDNPDYIPPNPYDPGGISGPGVLPPGTFDDSSDAIPDSSLPTLSAANTGFTRIYNPTLAQVQDLARYLWTDETVIETIWNKIRQYFENPMDAIIGFNLVPVPIPDGGTKNFALMYIDTGVSMTAAANQFVDRDCGTVKLERYYGSALDQSPYTKVSCFLPFIGVVSLNTDEVMGTTLQVKYRVDIVSGSCVAKILVDGNVLYQYSGHCAIPIPFASADFTSYVSAAISVAKLAVAAGAALAGAPAIGAGVATADVGQQTSQTTTLTRTVTNTTRNPSTGRQIISGTTTTVEQYEEPVSETGTKASFSGLSPANIANTVGQVMASKPNVEHSGSFSGNTGYLGVRRPYLIIERPNMCLPENYQKLNGYPAMITMSLGSCKGYTRVQQVQLTGLPATNPEQAEILSLLKSGVIF